MLLRAADIARIFESNPWVTSFKQHAEHLAPQLLRWNATEWFQLTTIRFLLISNISFFKCFTKLIMQIWSVGRREQCPITIFHDALHKQVRNPIRSIHVMCTTAVVTSVLAQLQEFFNVQVPCFQVGANRTLTLTALVHSNCSVIYYLKEWHNTL